MKKLIAIILCCVITLTVTACSQPANNTEPTTKTQTQSEKPIEEIKEELTKKLDDFEGIVYLTKNGELIYSQASGPNECGADLTVDSPMFIGSVSKQFCATTIMMLKEQGKLSLDDPMSKYFPEYEIGKDVTIKNLLTMRSGVPEMLEILENFSLDNTDSENTAIFKEWLFAQPLNFEPDTSKEYSNSNYILLANIIEMVTQTPYHEYIRENILNPLGMDHTGFLEEVNDNPYYSDSLTFDTFVMDYHADGVAKGAGDIISTAPDMDKWMTAFKNCELISEESYREMIADHSPDVGDHYGYGIMGFYKKGIGHTGSIGDYLSLDYINEEHGYNLFVSTYTSGDMIVNLPTTIMDTVLDD